MRVLVTRPEPDATALKAHLVAQGHEVLIEPLMELRFDDLDPIELGGVQALIATSRNGLRALAASPELEAARQLPLFAVGPGPAATARGLGFQMVIKGPGTGRELVSLITDGIDVNAGSLLHLAGDVLAFDFVAELGRLGYHVLQPLVYVAEPVQRLSGSTVTRLRNGQIAGVLLLSPRTAQIYADLLHQHDLVEASSNLVHYCISEATADRLADLGQLKVEIAEAPNLKEVLALTARAAPQSA